MAVWWQTAGPGLPVTRGSRERARAGELAAADRAERTACAGGTAPATDDRLTEDAVAAQAAPGAAGHATTAEGVAGAGRRGGAAVVGIRLGGIVVGPGGGVTLQALGPATSAGTGQ